MSAWGRIDPADGSSNLDWAIGGADRWYRPAVETSTRQQAVAGTPVIETRVRVPGGDAIHRAFVVAGGHVVVEIENASPAPFAVAFSNAEVVGPVAPSAVPESAPLPPGWVAFALAHRARLTIVWPRASMPPRVPTSESVVRGWQTQCDRGVRYELPDEALLESLTAARCALLLDGPLVSDDPATRLLAAGEWVRLGEDGRPLVPALADAVHALARTHSEWALRSGADVLRAAGEDQAASDVDDIIRRQSASEAEPVSVLARVRSLVRAGAHGGIELLPRFPEAWVGQSVAVYGEHTPLGRLSFAVRWHGSRPALLWELDGPGTVSLLRCGLDPTWSTTEPRGDALLAPYSSSEGE
ncbi:MAG: hypothetical protein ABJD24_02395 [Acidimicrobiales bacterium]